MMGFWRDFERKGDSRAGEGGTGGTDWGMGEHSLLGPATLRGREAEEESIQGTAQEPRAQDQGVCGPQQAGTAAGRTRPGVAVAPPRVNGVPGGSPFLSSL